MAEPKRLKRAAGSGWLAGCCAVGVSLLIAAQAFAAVTVSVETSDGVQGGNLTLEMSLSRADTDPQVAGAQVDLIFDTSQIDIIGTCSNGGGACQGSDDCGDGTCDLPCVKDARLTEQTLTATLPTTVRPPDPEGTRRLRLAVFNDTQNPTATFDSGSLATCTFQVQADATPGETVSLTSDRLVASDANDTEIPDVQIEIIPGTIHQATPTPTATQTPRPTPTIPCFVDQDCPLGQVCEGGFCVPAPTPTPTIACPDGVCPEGLTCVDGICVDLSTPTPTPTPLPPCETDADCLAGFHCRANVCVPIRECDDQDPVLDRVNCRGIREACTDGVCECGGDCNLDGYVFGNETTQMTCVLSGECPLTDCQAGDFNGDGEITGAEICAAVTNLGLGCPAEGQPLSVGQDRSDEIRSLDIGSASGAAGTEVTIPIDLSGGGEVATAQMDLLFDTAVLNIPDPSASCQVDPRLDATEVSFNFLPQTPQTPPGMARLRLFVGNTEICKTAPSYPVSSFDAGPLLSCVFRINPNASEGMSELTAERLNVGDSRGNEFGTAFSPGTVTVLPAPTCTTDEDCPDGTHCRAGVCKPIVECTNYAECGTSGRDSCVDGFCECSGDCNLDGTVSPSEVSTAVQIFGEELPVTACLAADQKGDGQVMPSEVALSVTNFGLDCPTP